MDSGTRGLPGARSLGNRASLPRDSRLRGELERQSYKWRREGRVGSDADRLPAAWAGLRVSFLGYPRTSWKVRKRGQFPGLGRLWVSRHGLRARPEAGSLPG